MKKYSIAVLIAALIALTAGSASADLMAVGAAEVSNSWTQQFNVNDTWMFFSAETSWADNFDAMTINMTQGELEDPALTDASPAFSTIDYTNADYDVVAYGWNMQDVDFTLHFEGFMNDPVAFDLKVYDFSGGPFGGGGYYASGWATASWNGTDWTIVDNSMWLDQCGDPIGLQVPVPGAVLLGMLGLSVAGARLRKNR
ncbi:MAG: hypothetical protein GXY19_16455 [Phycisphaerae bacterium]|nr:hypothetical protein [Phycisphaerae bacterium]